MSNLSEISQYGQVLYDSSTTKKINNLLNSSKTRVTGLEMLNSYLPHCSDDDFIAFCVSWMQNCCKIDGPIKNGKFGIEVLSSLFKISSNYQELKKSVSFFITTRYFDYFFKYFINYQAGWSCTEICFLLYRGACGPFQESLEKHLTNLIGKNSRISLAVAKCFALLPSLGGGGNEGINYRNNWKSQFFKFLNICNSVLNDLFVNVEELQEDSHYLGLNMTCENLHLSGWLHYQMEKLSSQWRASSKLEFCSLQIPKASASPPPLQGGTSHVCSPWLIDVGAWQEPWEILKNLRELQKEYESLEHTYNKSLKNSSPSALGNQLHNHCLVLNFMLLNEYPAGKSVPTDLALQLICRGLAINPKSLRKHQTTDIMALQEALPEVHGILLSLLKALIVACKSQLLPYSYLICKLIKQTLEWTKSDFKYGSEKPFGFLRISAYEALTNWLAIARNGSCVESISNVVLYDAVSDITSKEEAVLLKESKEKKKIKGTEQTTRLIHVFANARLCYAALKTLQFVLKFTGVLLKAEEQRFLQEAVLKLISDIQNKPPSDLVVPFSASTCRKELYSLLLELVQHPCPKWPPPIHFALRLFIRGENDRCPNVSQFCSTAVNYSTVIIHPQFDNGGFWTFDAIVERSRDRVTLTGDERTEPEGPWNESAGSLEKGNESSKENGGEDEDKEGSLEGKASEESDMLSNEDSINTVVFSKTADACERGDISVIEENAGESSENNTKKISFGTSQDEPAVKKSKIDTRHSELENTPSPVKEVDVSVVGNEPWKTPKAVEEGSVKSVSPESTSEEGMPKKRYFLRSITSKGSSEEPEEGMKRTSSPESARNTPTRSVLKGTPSIQGSKRPRTRAQLKTVESEGEGTPKRSDRDDDENIIDTFIETFVDF